MRTLAFPAAGWPSGTECAGTVPTVGEESPWSRLDTVRSYPHHATTQQVLLCTLKERSQVIAVSLGYRADVEGAKPRAKPRTGGGHPVRRPGTDRGGRPGEPEDGTARRARWRPDRHDLPVLPRQGRGDRLHLRQPDGRRAAGRLPGLPSGRRAGGPGRGSDEHPDGQVHRMANGSGDGRDLVD